MKIAILSDIHGNLPALTKVMEHLQTVDHDVKACLGDLVGYGPYPNECVEIVLKEFNYIIMGNHDLAAVDPKEAAWFNPMAREAIEWTQKALTEENKQILRELGYGYVIDDDIFLIHGSPRAPFAYADTEQEALNGFINPIKPFNVAFVGHTHEPQVWQFMKDKHLALIRTNFNGNHNLGCEFSMVLPKEDKAIINVGSVGQPRDNDPRACYVVYDTELRLVTYYRIPYSIDRTIGRMQQLEFSINSWMRLLHGK
jgi:predicted phosphodiesterase